MGTIEENISARREAEQVLDLCGEQPARFWESLIELAQAKLPPKPAAYDPMAAMDEQEAIRFERQKLNYGRFANQEIGTVPTDYIGWMVENDFAIDLRRYIKSERFQRRQREE